MYVHVLLHLLYTLLLVTVIVRTMTQIQKNLKYCQQIIYCWWEELMKNTVVLKLKVFSSSIENLSV